MENLKKYLTIKEVSELLSIPVGTLYNYVSSGKIPYFKIGGHVRFSIPMLEKWLQSKQHIPEI